jgi:NAD+ kinase
MPSVDRISVMTHGKPETIGDAVARVEEAASRAGVQIVDGDDDGADLCVVLGGDGTMLRALKRYLGTSVAVLGVNFGRVGFLTAIPSDELTAGLARAFDGGYEVVDLPTLTAETAEQQTTAVNDAVAASSALGRMVELGWSVGQEDLGVLACDGVIASTPSGSTAYNLSNGGPVLVWGLDAMAITFIAPHSLHARPLVVPRSAALVVENRTPDVAVTLLADGHEVSRLERGKTATIRLGDQTSRLATVPGETFFRRYRHTFAS